MLTLPPGTKVFLATERVDGRKGINGLSVLVRSQLGEDPLSGHMFVFFSRRADRCRGWLPRRQRHYNNPSSSFVLAMISEVTEGIFIRAASFPLPVRPRAGTRFRCR